MSGSNNIDGSLISVEQGPASKTVPEVRLPGKGAASPIPGLHIEVDRKNPNKKINERPFLEH